MKDKSIAVKYYIGEGTHTQADRDWVQQAVAFYNGRSIHESSPSSATVTSELNPGIQGFSEEVNADNAPVRTFRCAKHAFSLMSYIQQNRHLHNNIRVCISVDDSGFLPIWVRSALRWELALKMDSLIF